MSKRVAILTGGGEVPGLNVCIKSLVYQVIDYGFEPLGVRKGWEGLINYNPREPASFSDHFVELTKNQVRSIDHTSGSFLHSSRIDPQRFPSAKLPEFLKGRHNGAVDLSDHLLKVTERLGVKALIVLGDDDMLRYAASLSARGVPIIAIPKTIHNNINGTDYTLGFSTGLARGVSFIHELRALAGSREQIIIIETYGSHAGISALLTAYLASVDRLLIPEVPYDPLQLAYLIQQDKQMHPNNYAMVMVTNGARIAEQRREDIRKYLSPHSFALAFEPVKSSLDMANGLNSSGRIAAELLQNLIGEELFFQQLTYLMRSGMPDGQDLLGATNFGLMAAQLLQRGEFGRMTAFQKNKTWTHVALDLAVQSPKLVDVNAWYDVQGYKPKSDLIWGLNTEN